MKITATLKLCCEISEAHEPNAAKIAAAVLREMKSRLGSDFDDPFLIVLGAGNAVEVDLALHEVGVSVSDRPRAGPAYAGGSDATGTNLDTTG